MKDNVKIVLDADVIIHFIKADSFSLIFNILPNHQFIILDVVYDEVTKNKTDKLIIDNSLKFFSKRFSLIKFNPLGDSRMEYARLRNILLLGKGESACMVYCRDNKDIIGSSNLKDIKKYCRENKILFLTTLDFLYYAFHNDVMNKSEIDIFIKNVIAKGSKIPLVDIETYIPNNLI